MFLSAEMLRIHAKPDESGLSTDSVRKIGQCGVTCRIIAPLKMYAIPVTVSVVPNIGGALCSVYLRKQYRRWYQNLRRMDYCPPHWFYFPAFNITYACMGLSSYMVYAEGGFEGPAKTALQFYGIHLAFTWLWVPLFFKCRKLGMALLDSVFMAVCSGATLWVFEPISLAAATLYIIPFAYSCYLVGISFFFWQRNPSLSGTRSGTHNAGSSQLLNNGRGKPEEQEILPLSSSVASNDEDQQVYRPSSLRTAVDRGGGQGLPLQVCQERPVIKKTRKKITLLVLP